MSEAHVASAPGPRCLSMNWRHDACCHAALGSDASSLRPFLARRASSAARNRALYFFAAARRLASCRAASLAARCFSSAARRLRMIATARASWHLRSQRFLVGRRVGAGAFFLTGMTARFDATESTWLAPLPSVPQCHWMFHLFDVTCSIMHQQLCLTSSWYPSQARCHHNMRNQQHMPQEASHRPSPLVPKSRLPYLHSGHILVTIASCDTIWKL